MDEVEQATIDRALSEIMARVELVVNATAAMHDISIPWILVLPGGRGETHVISNLEPDKYRQVLDLVTDENHVGVYSQADTSALN